MFIWLGLIFTRCIVSKDISSLARYACMQTAAAALSKMPCHPGKDAIAVGFITQRYGPSSANKLMSAGSLPWDFE